MTSSNGLTAVLLSGGAGRRVGGRDKGLIEWRGKPLAAHVCERLLPQVSELLISCNRNAEAYHTMASTVVTDRRHGYEGPLAGLEACAGYITTPYLLVASCDTPLLPEDLAVRLLAPLRAAGDQSSVSFASDGERDHYLLAALRRETLSTLEPYLDSGQRAVRHWYRQFNPLRVDFSDSKSCFENLNTLP